MQQHGAAAWCSSMVQQHGAVVDGGIHLDLPLWIDSDSPSISAAHYGVAHASMS
jgi:hypothetical protein